MSKKKSVTPRTDVTLLSTARPRQIDVNESEPGESAMVPIMSFPLARPNPTLKALPDLERVPVKNVQIEWWEYAAMLGPVLSKVNVADLASSIQVRVLVEPDRWVTFIPTLGPSGQPMVDGQEGTIAMWAYAESREPVNLQTGELDSGDMEKAIHVEFPLRWEPVEE